MNIRYIILIILAILFWRHGYAQYPAAGTKQRLGYQTTGDGLVFRGNGAPAYTPSGLNNAWMYIDTLTRNLYAFTGGTWQLVSGGGSAFDGHVDSLVFNTNVTVIDSTAKMYWDANSETISVGVDGGAVYQLGEELYYPLIINKSGATIYNGQCVMVDTATLVTGDHVRIILARNGATYPSSYIMGVATTDIPNDSTGLVTWFGYVREVKHADIAQTGVTLVPGNILYPSTTEPGRYTNVAPTTPAHKSTVALVVRKPSDNNITLLVRPQLAQRLADLSDVNTSSVTGLSVLRYNSTTGVWDASATPGIVAADTASMLSPYLRKVDTLSLSNRINLKLNIADTTAMLAPYAKGSSTAGRMAYWSGTRDLTGSANLTWTEANKTLGINTTTTSGANLIIKNSQEPTRTTVVATQTFGADTTNWTRGTGWTFNGTQAVATAATGALTYTPALTITSGNGYEVTFSVASYSAGTATIRIGNAFYTVPQINQTNNVVLLRPTDATGGFRITTSTFTGNFDNITVVEISNPAPILISGQDDGSTILYNPLVMPNSSTIGFGGGVRYTTGTSNNVMGNSAGQNLTSATGNNLFGLNAGSLTTSGSNNNFFGSDAGRNNTIGGSNNFFGNGAGSLTVSGNANNFYGYQAGYGNTTGSNNSFFGNQAGLKNTTGNNNAYFGVGAGQNANGSANNYFGQSAGEGLFGQIATGFANNAFGQEAGRFNFSGSYNNFFGVSSGVNNYSGSYNNFFGWLAGRNNRSGENNNFYGRSAGASNTLGSNNIFIGLEAGYNSTSAADTLTGNRNIGFGALVANNIKGGASDNIAMGFRVQLPNPTGSNQLVIGNLLFGKNLGTFTTIPTNGRFGVLQSDPTYVLDINSTDAIRFPIGTTAQRPTGATGVVRYNSDSTKLEFHNGTSWNGLQSTITNPVTGTGTAGQVSYWSGTGAQAGSNNLFWDNTNARLGVRTNSPTGAVSIFQPSVSFNGLEVTLAEESTFGAVGAYRKARGTQSAQTAVLSGDRLGAIGLQGYDGASYQNDILIFGSAAQNFTTANHGTNLIVETVSLNSLSRSEKFRITANSRFGFLQASPSYTLDINATDAIRLPVGTTAQQPTGAAGIVRYNSSSTALEYHNGTAWKTVANTDNTAQTFNFSINIYNASDSVKNITSPANFFLVPANLNGYCIDSYQVKALSGTGTADIQLAKNGSGANTQAISGTTAYNKDTNVTLATGDVIQGQVFNLSAGATLVGLGFTIEIKATCN